MSQIKNELMKEYRAKRSLMDCQLRERESEAVCEKLQQLPEWIAAKHVMIYLSAGEELATLNLVTRLLQEKKKEVYVPFVVDKEKGIAVSKLTDFAHLVPGTFRILEPRPQYRDAADPSILDLVIVPGIVFDRRGGRIGYGHGYYDRFLKKTKAAKIGLAFEFQVLAEIPQSPMDVRVDSIVTASEVIRT